MKKSMCLEEKLVLLRKEQGLSQTAVAERLEISRQAISRWEMGSAVPTAENLKCLSELYQVPVDFLLNEEWDFSQVEEARNRASALLAEGSAKTGPETDVKNRKISKGTVAVIAAVFLLGLGIGIFVGKDLLPGPVEKELIPWEDTEKEILPDGEKVGTFQFDW